MGRYVYIDKDSKKGRFGIGVGVFEFLANDALKRVPGLVTDEVENVSAYRHKLKLNIFQRGVDDVVDVAHFIGDDFSSSLTNLADSQGVKHPCKWHLTRFYQRIQNVVNGLFLKRNLSCHRFWEQTALIDESLSLFKPVELVVGQIVKVGVVIIASTVSELPMNSTLKMPSSTGAG